LFVTIAAMGATVAFAQVETLDIKARYPPFFGGISTLPQRTAGGIFVT
jgi:hypothetical protein